MQVPPEPCTVTRASVHPERVSARGGNWPRLFRSRSLTGSSEVYYLCTSGDATVDTEVLGTKAAMRPSHGRQSSKQHPERTPGFKYPIAIGPLEAATYIMTSRVG